MTKPPWEQYPTWANSRDRVLELLREAIVVREEVAERLNGPKDNCACRGYVFYHYWVQRVAELAENTPFWRIINRPRGIFALDDVPLRLYRADEEAPIPKRVVRTCLAEAKQLSLLALFGVEIDEDGNAEEPDSVLRIRVITDPDGQVIEQFVFEEVTSEGAIGWEWAIAVSEIPKRLEVPVASQPAPKVVPRKGKKTDTADDDE